MDTEKLQSLIIEKSKLLLKANEYKSNGLIDESKKHFQKVAQIEEDIAKQMKSEGNNDWYINSLSAASSWVHAQEMTRALENYILVLREKPEININNEILWFLTNNSIKYAIQIGTENQKNTALIEYADDIFNLTPEKFKDFAFVEFNDNEKNLLICKWLTEPIFSDLKNKDITSVIFLFKVLYDNIHKTEMKNIRNSIFEKMLEILVNQHIDYRKLLLKDIWHFRSDKCLRSLYNDFEDYLILFDVSDKKPLIEDVKRYNLNPILSFIDYDKIFQEIKYEPLKEIFTDYNLDKSKHIKLFNGKTINRKNIQILINSLGDKDPQEKIKLVWVLSKFID